jgi:hypothetical protein
MEETVNEISLDKLRENLRALASAVWEACKKIAERLREAFAHYFNDAKKKWEAIKEFIEKQEQIKPKNYKQNLHLFLRTDSYQRRNMTGRSNIYHSSGKKYNNYRGRS